MNLQFSGHDSFVCKHFWLKKGYDFITSGKRTFTDELAVVDLGVGKNMVTAINYWLKAYGIVEDNQSNIRTEFGDTLFGRNGFDPYLENIGSIWLLHYYLVKTNKASLYNLFFNEFRKGRFEFTKEQLSSYLLRKVESVGRNNISPNTLTTDIAVFIRNYLSIEYRNRKIDIEDEFSNLMIDLQLLTSEIVENADKIPVEWYKLESNVRYDLPYQVVLFSILDNNNYSHSISFQELLTGYNSPGVIFALSEDGLYQQLLAIKENYHGNIDYKETAGIRELQFKTESKPTKWSILHEYYSA